MAKLVDLVKITCNSTGTGALMLGKAVPGNRGSEVLTNGEEYSYAIQQGDNYEFGRGTYLSLPPRLVRSPTDSSVGGTALNLQPNAQVALVALADDIQNPIGGNAVSATGLETPRVIATTGDVIQQVTFDGRSNVTAPATIAQNAVTNAKMATMPDATLKGVVLAGAPTDLTPPQVAAIVQPAIDAIPRPRSYAGPFVLTDLGSNTPTPGSYFSAGGNALSFQTLISSGTGTAERDNQRATALITAATVDDGNSEEQTLCLLTSISTGYSKPWATSTGFTVGTNTTTNGNTYRCTTGGTSAATGTGPSGKGSTITDGTVVWKWINDAAINAKVGLYNEVHVLPGGGHSWAQANNLEIDAGYISDFAVNTEFDLTNNSGTDSTVGGKNKYNLLITTQGANTSTAAVEINTTNTTKYAALWGIHFSGTTLASNAVISIDTSSAVGIGFGPGLSGGVFNISFSTAVIRDQTTAPKALDLAGSYTSSAIEISGTSPAALALNGTFASWLIFTPSVFKVTSVGDVYANSYRTSLGNGPASSTSAGNPGDLRFDANFMYVCTSTSNWKRVALASF